MSVRSGRARAQSQDDLKRQSAVKAVEYVQSGMRIGLGTGSTAAFAVERVGELVQSGELRDIIAVPTSVKTQQQAQRTPPLSASSLILRMTVLVLLMAERKQFHG